MAKDALRWVAAFLFALGAAPASAETLNVDLGAAHGSPSSGYGAAAGTPGVWNTIGLGTSALVGLDGSPSGVSVEVVSATDTGTTSGPATDDHYLLGDNIYDCDDPDEWSLDFSGLENGAYDVYLYAPANTVVHTGDMIVNGVALSSIPGDISTLVEGESYVWLRVRVLGGALAISGDATSSPKCAGLSGVQLVGPLPHPPLELYVDLGAGQGSPSSNYGAAAGTPGVWNTIGLGTSALVGLDGSPSGVSVEVVSATDTGTTSGPATDDHYLLGDNIYDCDDPDEWSLDFSGLENGAYDVYLYAPANTVVHTGDMIVNGVALSSIPGDISTLVEGESYVWLRVRVLGGALAISGDATSSPKCAGLSGVQLAGPLAREVPALRFAGLGLLFGSLAAVAALALRRRHSWLRSRA